MVLGLELCETDAFFCTKPVQIKVISGFQALRQAKAPMTRQEPANANLRADLLATVPSTPSHKQMTDCPVSEQPVKRFDFLPLIGYSQVVGENFTTYFVSVSFTKLACGRACCDWLV
ncbi:hypothetical protein PoB_005984600 [Plakobranchus ocellatus]|uniref:Uncharacterized protein n=1 Tax=Plakobranchus ocellatus TaxID=259542 RepID=A0AAV4CDE0_9GAST|nr:hypothetical protein PoB_005984600 [Plakobranchus ocellatus]